MEKEQILQTMITARENVTNSNHNVLTQITLSVLGVKESTKKVLKLKIAHKSSKCIYMKRDFDLITRKHKNVLFRALRHKNIRKLPHD